MRPEEFIGGDATVRPKLEELGFVVRAREPEPSEPFSEIMRRVLELQRSYSSSNTPEMELRGRLVRHDGRRTLQLLLSDLPTFSFNPEIEGRDGTGLKTRVPWIRIFDKQRSPSATSGWYVAYLFAADGSAVYLSLNQGTTTFEGGEFRSRPPAYLQQRAEWGAFDSRLTQRRTSVAGDRAARSWGPGTRIRARQRLRLPLRQRNHSR